MILRIHVVVLLSMVFQPLGHALADAGDVGQIRVGWAQTEITPPRPVALVGQLHKRISRGVLDPLTLTVLALESTDADGHTEQAILVSCDVISIRKVVVQRLREAIQSRIRDFDVDKLVLNATHTHTAPGFVDGAFRGLYDVSEDEGVMKASQYADFFIERAAQAVAQAWENRTPGAMSWALGHAVVGMNRRAHYFDGSSVMYGDTRLSDFSHLEGYEDHGVEMLFFWDGSGQVSGIVINLACPSQEVEHLYEISADFWHDVRQAVRDRLGQRVFILPQCAAAGDQSPHPLWRRRAEEIMRNRRGVSNRQEIARRIARAVDEAMPLARQDVRRNPVFRHRVARVDLPAYEPPAAPFYETDPIEGVEFHVLRLGDVAMATNPFELFLDYGIRIKARSPAVLTMIVQLSCQSNGYLPTERAVRGGGYSADKFIVGPEGGQVLVEETLKQLVVLYADEPSP